VADKAADAHATADLKTYSYKWKGKYAGMQTSDVRRLRQLEDENGSLKKLLAEAHLDVAGLKNALTKSTQPSR